MTTVWVGKISPMVQDTTVRKLLDVLRLPTRNSNLLSFQEFLQEQASLLFHRYSTHKYFILLSQTIVLHRFSYL